MKPISHARQRFPADVFRQTVCLYFQFTLSLRDVEDLMAERDINVSYETIRCWTQKFGRLFARNLRRTRPCPTGRGHLDGMVARIAGQSMYLWRAIDDEGEVLDMPVQKRRNKLAALRLLRKMLKYQGIRPETIVTDGLLSYGAAVGELGCSDRHRPRAAAKQQSRREFASTDPTLGEKAAALQIAGFCPRFLATYAFVYNTFNVQRHLIRRSTLHHLRTLDQGDMGGSNCSSMSIEIGVAFTSIGRQRDNARGGDS